MGRQKPQKTRRKDSEKPTRRQTKVNVSKREKDSTEKKDPSLAQVIQKLTEAATIERVANMRARQAELEAAAVATGACQGKSVEKIWTDERGKFKKGNPGGPGNPFIARMQVLRKVANEVIKAEDTVKFMRVVTTKALQGDPAFAKMYIELTGQAPKKEPPEEREGDATEDPDFEYL